MHIIILPQSIPDDVVQWYSWQCNDGLSSQQLHLLRHIHSLHNGWVTECKGWIVKPVHVTLDFQFHEEKYSEFDMVQFPYPDTYYITRKYAELLLRMYDKPFTYYRVHSYDMSMFTKHGNCTTFQPPQNGSLIFRAPQSLTTQIHENKIKIYISSPFDNSDVLYKFFSKCMIEDLNFVLTNIYDHEDINTWCVCINKPVANFMPNMSRTIVFQMEPDFDDSNWHFHYNSWMIVQPQWYMRHNYSYNNLEWHVNCDVKNFGMNHKKTKTLSAVLSSQYRAPGHRARIDFWKYFQENSDVDYDFYGRDNNFGFKNYKGALQNWDKGEALFPYKYTFNAENCDISNYYTEKLVDGILCECLTFYWGCKNLSLYLPKGSYIPVDITDHKSATDTICESIKNDVYNKHYPMIMDAKIRILSKLQVAPRIHNILNFDKVQIYILKDDEIEAKIYNNIGIYRYTLCNSESEVMELLYNGSYGIVLLRASLVLKPHTLDALCMIANSGHNTILNISHDDAMFDKVVELNMDTDKLHESMCYYMNHATILKKKNICESIRSGVQWNVLRRGIC